MPAARKLLLSDAELLDQLAKKSPTAVARENGVGESSVRWRVKQIRQNLPAPAARRSEEIVGRTLDALAIIQDNLRILGALKRATLRLLEHPTLAGELDLGPHDYDLEVMVADGMGPPVKRRLNEITAEGGLETLQIQSRMADPRQFLLSVMRQEAQQLELGVRLVERVTDAQDVAAFQEEVLHAIEAAEPETAQRIRGAILARRTLRLALRPPGPETGRL
jgi:hypothetical protein